MSDGTPCEALVGRSSEHVCAALVEDKVVRTLRVYLPGDVDRVRSAVTGVAHRVYTTSECCLEVKGLGIDVTHRAYAKPRLTQES